MHFAGEIVQICRDAVWLERTRSVLDHRREIHERLDQLRLLRQLQQREIGITSCDRRRIDLAHTKDPAHPGVRHLDVVDRILLRLRPREIDVEHELRVALPHQKEVPHRIASDLVDEIPHGDVAPGALRDLHLFAAAHHRHHLMQHILRIALRNPHVERLQPDAHAGHCAVMIGALHVDRPRESALPLRDVIGDVGDEVRGRAAPLGAAQHDAILVVPELGGAQPERAVPFVRVPSRLLLSKGLVHFLVGVQRRLEEVDVELDAERLQVAVLLLAELLDREATHRLDVLRELVGRIRGDVALRDVADVLAVIAPFGDRRVASHELPHARLHAEREVVDLGAGVVVVELARHAPTGCLEE